MLNIATTDIFHLCVQVPIGATRPLLATRRVIFPLPVAFQCRYDVQPNAALGPISRNVYETQHSGIVPLFASTWGQVHLLQPIPPESLLHVLLRIVLLFFLFHSFFDLGDESTSLNWRLGICNLRFISTHG